MGLLAETLVLTDVYFILSWFSSWFCVHLKGKNGDFKQPLNISQWRYSTELVVLVFSHDNCRSAKSGQGQPVRNQTVK